MTKKYSLNIALYLFSFLFSMAAFSAGKGGGGHDAHISDLVFPAINFILLFGFLLWKAKKPISDSFTRNAEEVESLYLVAEEKDKEAQVKLDMFQKKMESIESERNKILSEANKDAENFEQEHKKEVEKHIERLEKETENKLVSEKNEMLNELNQTLLDKVISKTKSTVKENTEYKNKATQKLLSNIE